MNLLYWESLVVLGKSCCIEADLLHRDGLVVLGSTGYVGTIFSYWYHLFVLGLVLLLGRAV